MGSSYLPVHWIPLFMALWFPISFIITYSLAVDADHVYAWWPSISATGANPPESCFFSFFVNISTFTLVFAGYIRHAQLREYSSYRPNITPGPWTNLIASLFGAASMLGLFIVANWQITTEFKVHFVGAELCFICSTIYFAFQTVFSFWMAPELNSLLIFVIRAIICLFMFGLNICCIATNLKAYEIVDCNDMKKLMHWDSTLPGYEWHLAYTISEWCLMLTFSLGILTFFYDFKNIMLEEPVVKAKNKWNATSYNF